MHYLRDVILDIAEFLKMRKDLPLVDVRSESEFHQGHVPGASNVPLLNDHERVVVGTTYKQVGQLAAIKEGFRLVGPRLLDIIHASERLGNELIVHCWRGGMRSGNFCQFVGMAGIRTHQLRGGYKAYRQIALSSFARPYRLVVLSGLTGSGKTEVLQALRKSGEQVINLEGLAQHKGSVFGGLGLPAQPTTEQFQNNLFEALNALDVSKRIWVEDESIAVGKVFLPLAFWTSMGVSPVVAMTIPMEVRLQRLVREYGNHDREAFGLAMKGITRKLGGQHYKEAVDQLAAGNMERVIEIVLTYYDKAYMNGLNRKKDRIIVSAEWDGKGTPDAFANYLVREVNKSDTALVI